VKSLDTSVRETAITMLNQALATDVTRTGPKSFDELAEIALNLGATRVIKRPLSLGDHGNVSGMLVPNDSGYLIAINERVGESRQLYSLAHEIGHLIHIGNQASRRSLARRERYRGKWDHHDDPEEERLCEVIAAELLMPQETFSRHAERLDSSLKSIPNLCKWYGTSITATTIRLVELCTKPRLLVRWLRDKRRQGNMRVSWQIRNSMEGPAVEVSTTGGRTFAGAKTAWIENGLIVTDETLLERVTHGTPRYVRFPVMKTESSGFGIGTHRFVLSVVYLNDVLDDTAVG